MTERVSEPDPAGVPPLDLGAIERRLARLTPRERTARLARAEAALLGGEEALTVSSTPVPAATPRDSSDRAIDALRRHGTLKRFQPKQLLLPADTASEEVLLIESGLVKVLVSGEHHTKLIAGFHGPGELIGELGAILGQPRDSIVVAHTEGSAVHVPCPEFLTLLGTNPDVLRLVSSSLRRRLRPVENHGVPAAFLDIPARVARQLLDWAKVRGEQTEAGVLIHGLSKAELARSLESSVKTVDAVLNDLRDKGLITTRHKGYLLFDPARLIEVYNEA